MIGLIAVALLLSGCGSNKACRSENVARGGISVPDIRIPDGMSEPDTSEALRVPTGSSRGGVDEGECLETPPKYFERPGAVAGSPEALINRWVEAWNNKDADLLFTFYATEFAPPEGTLEEWRIARIRQVTDPEPVRVSIEALSLSPAPGGQMQARFIQRFESSGNSFAIQREMLLIRLDNTWYILAERVTDVL